MTATAEIEEEARFSGFSRPRAVGLGMMSLPASLLFIANLFVVTQTMGFMPGWMKLLAVGELLVFLIACIVRDADGITLWSRTARKLRFSLISSTGITDYRTTIPQEKVPANVLSSTDALEYVPGTDNGTPFTALHYPDAQQYAVPMICRPNGGERMGVRERNQRTADWAGLGNDLAQIPSARQYTVTVEAAPRTEVEARRQMEDYIHPDAPAGAQEVTRERLNIGLEEHAGLTTWVTITFDAIEKGNSEAARRANAEHIAQLLPGIKRRLSTAGAGRVRYATERDLAEYHRMMIDPRTRPLIEEAHAEGEDTGITWKDSGPVSWKPRHDYLVHDGAVSQTMYMTQPPAGQFPDTVLRGLLEPHPDVEIKRVTLVKQVIHPGRATVLTQRDIGSAENRRENQRRSGKAKLEEKIALRNADENAEGFALEDFTIMVSVTVTDPAQLKRAGYVVRSALGPGAGARFRIASDQQDVGFLYCGPFGLDLHGHNVAERGQRHLSMTK